MAQQDEDGSPSVRVELDSTLSSDDDAPEVESSSSSPSRLSLALLLFAAIGVPVILLLLSSGSGSDAPQEGPLSAPPAIEEPAILSRSDSAADPTPLQLTRVDDPEPISSVVRLDDGFVGHSFGESLTPIILRSDDGDTWIEVETTATSLGTQIDEERLWFDLRLSNGRLQLRGQILNDEADIGLPQDLFVSDDGVLWEQFDGIGTLDERASLQSVLSLDSDGYFASNLAFEELSNSFLAQHTTLEGLARGECGFADESGEGEPRFVIFDCVTGDTTREIAPSDFESSFSNARLEACLSVLADPGFNQAIVRQSFDGERVLLAQLVFIAPPVVLEDGGIALANIDRLEDGDFAPAVGRCDGIVDVLSVREGSVILVDGDSTEVRQWPIPEPEDGSVLNLSQVLGEFSSTGGVRQLVVSDGLTLWSLDTATGTWTMVQGDPDESQLGRSPTFGGSAIQQSATSELFYAVTRDQLVVIRPDPDTSELSALLTIPIERPELRFRVDRVLYGDDESVFVQFESQVWRLALS